MAMHGATCAFDVVMPQRGSDSEGVGGSLDAGEVLDAEVMYREVKRAMNQQVEALVELELARHAMQDACANAMRGTRQAETTEEEDANARNHVRCGGRGAGERKDGKRRRKPGTDQDEHETVGTDESSESRGGGSETKDADVSIQLEQCSEMCMELTRKVGELHRQLQALNRQFKRKRKRKSSATSRRERRDAQALAPPGSPHPDPAEPHPHVPSPKQVSPEIPSKEDPSMEESEDFSGGSLL